MELQKGRDTRPEVELRSQLHRAGMRFFVHRSPIPTLRRKADIVFPRLRIAVYVDGCFWHGCPTHGTWPKSNAAWWRNKIETNRERDRDTDERLTREGWTVIRIWEHEDPETATNKVLRSVQLKRNK